MSTNYYSEKSIEKLHTLLSDTIIHGSDIINDLIDQLSQIIMFDRVNIFLNGSKTPDFGFSVSFVKNRGYLNPDIINDNDYLTLFTKNKIVISNIHRIEYTLPETFNLLSAAGISSLMQYLITDSEGNVKGLITGEVFDHFAAFPKLAVQLFETTSRTINSILIREGKI
jgi:hypothetical protein